MLLCNHSGADSFGRRFLFQIGGMERGKSSTGRAVGEHLKTEVLEHDGA